MAGEDTTMTEHASTGNALSPGANEEALFMAIGRAAEAFAALPHGLCYGLYDYSSYQGDAPPHVVKDPDGLTVFRSEDPDAAREEYERLSRLHAGKFILRAAEEASRAAGPQPPVPAHAFRAAMHMLLATPAAQYLLATTRSRSNGPLKAAMHEELTLSYVAAWHGISPDRVRRRHEADYRLVHDATACRLTDVLDRAIGFDIDAYVSDRLVGRFIDAFHDVALSALAGPALAGPASGPADIEDGCDDHPTSKVLSPDI